MATVNFDPDHMDVCEEMFETAISNYLGAYFYNCSRVKAKDGKIMGAYRCQDSNKRYRYCPVGMYMKADFLNKISGTDDNLLGIKKLLKKYDAKEMFADSRVVKLANSKMGPEFLSRLQFFHDTKDYWVFPNNEYRDWFAANAQMYIKRFLPYSNQELQDLETLFSLKNARSTHEHGQQSKSRA